MYSSASLAMVGDNSLMEMLRVMVSIELFLNAPFYASHPIFVSTFSNHEGKVSTTIKNLLPMSVSLASLESGLTGEDLVRVEAISNCTEKVWSSFICILALSTVVNRKICSLYPDFGHEKYKLLFNQEIHPRHALPTLLLLFVSYLLLLVQYQLGKSLSQTILFHWC